MKRKIYILLCIFSLILVSRNGFAQRDSVDKAASTLKNQSLPPEKRIKQALEIIDKAITNPKSANDGYSWYVRGFIYKEWYKTFEAQNKNSKTRLNAVEYLKKSYDLFAKDTSASAKEYKDGIKGSLRYLASTFYNDAGTMLDTVHYEMAFQYYKKFKEFMLIAEPGYNLRPREVEFKTNLADQYGKIFRNNIRANKKFYGLAEVTYKEVLSIDPDFYGANYNLAMLYYNYGVDIINSMDLDLPIVDVDKIQDEAKENFKKALPYMLKAYSLNPKRREVLIALQGIYFSLYEFEKSDEFKAKLEKLEKNK
ncbi:MAG: hypothetical protein ACHQHP_00725 [Bacteroidia bacterium]